MKGKDVSGGIGSKLSGSSEIAFKAHSAADAAKWFEVIKSAAGGAPAGQQLSDPSSPVSPIEKRDSSPPTYAEGSGAAPVPEKQPAPLQTAGVTGGETVASPATATPTTVFPPTSGDPPAPAPVPEKM